MRNLIKEPKIQGFGQTFFMLALPMVAQNLVSSLLYIVDNLMVGQLGEIELAAVTQSNKLTLLITTVFYGIGAACTVFSSQAWGAGNKVGVHKAMGMSLTISLGVSTIAAAGAIFLPRQLIGLFTNDYAVMTVGISYLSCLWPSYLFLSIKTVWVQASISCGNTRLPMISSLISVLTNTGLNYLLIFGQMGFPALGAKGAAIATSIAAGLECLLMVSISYIRNLPSAFKPVPIKEFVPRFIKVAAPLILTDGIWALAQTTYAIIYGAMGTETVAALSISSTLDSFMHTFTAGMVGAGSVMVGMALGRKDSQEARATAGKVIKWVVLSGVLSAMIVILIRNPVSGFFNVSEETRKTGAFLIFIVGATIPLEALTWCLWSGILRAGGNTVYNMAAETATMWLIGVPLAAFSGLVLRWPIQWVILLTYADEVTKGIWGLLRFRSLKWIKDF